jgi:hypothetical protein
MHIQAILAASFAASTTLAFKPNQLSDGRNLALGAFAAAIAGAPALVHAGPIQPRDAEPDLSDGADEESSEADLNNLEARAKASRQQLGYNNLECLPEADWANVEDPAVNDYYGGSVWMVGCNLMKKEYLTQLHKWLDMPEHKKCWAWYKPKMVKLRDQTCQIQD